MPSISMSKPMGFEWDSHNQEKNWFKHKVSYLECEQAFRNTPQRIYKDKLHSLSEPRYTLLSITDKKRYLFITFTIRAKKVRVISARDQDKKERSLYEKDKK
ncbi:MAG: BrnT family toxin [bacterium]